MTPETKTDPKAAEPTASDDAPADRAREIRRLKRFLTQADGFELALAAYSRRENAAAVMAEIVDGLVGEGRMILQLDLRDHADDEVLLSLLIDLIGGGQAVDGVFVFGLEAHLDYAHGGTRAGGDGFLANANFQRDAFPDRVPVPVVLWVPALAQRAIATIAPDLWHWRRASFDFSEPTARYVEMVDRAVPRPEENYQRQPVEQARARIAMLAEMAAELGDPAALSADDRQWLARLLAERGETEREIGDWDAAEATARAALDIARADSLHALTARAWAVLGDIRTSRGDLDEALRIRREEELPVFERLGDVRSRAVTMGQNRRRARRPRRGRRGPAHLRREEELPVYERLGDVRSRAVTMGYIADVLAARGDVNEALRVRREEELPVYERLGDVRSRAVTMGKIADILAARGDVDEALRIRREEELPVYERLGDVRERAVDHAEHCEFAGSTKRSLGRP